MDNATEPRHGFFDCRFTLPGLLLIITVICVSIAMLIPALKATHESSNRAACVGNLSHLYKAMRVYVSEFGRNKDYMPHTGDAFFTYLLGHTSSEHLSSYVRMAPCRGNLTLYACPNSGSYDSTVLLIFKSLLPREESLRNPGSQEEPKRLPGFLSWIPGFLRGSFGCGLTALGYLVVQWPITWGRRYIPTFPRKIPRH